MSENGADVSWDDVGKVLEEEMSSAEDIQADLVRNNKGNICQSIDNCMTVFQRDPLLKGAIRKMSFLERSILLVILDGKEHLPV